MTRLCYSASVVFRDEPLPWLRHKPAHHITARKVGYVSMQFRLEIKAHVKAAAILPVI